MKSNIQSKIDVTLDSVNDAVRAEPKPFLFTRIMARLEEVKETYWERIGKLFSRPSIAIVGLSLMLVLNAAVIFININRAKNASQPAELVTSGDLPSVAITIQNPQP
ncbi:hypothetical protein [Ferruginibacter albus]|uniref:hypothetical protein n=1 Tax=Ferruginibacter albus TaxID=2875540 RepID=UPI001CC44435|nr:hypothetical protein [Ferruginibacter albus]UAY51944.1 hypothetical protein K9M53_15300 [Ferruginibacter albus]